MEVHAVPFTISNLSMELAQPLTGTWTRSTNALSMDSIYMKISMGEFSLDSISLHSGFEHALVSTVDYLATWDGDELDLNIAWETDDPNGDPVYFIMDIESF